VCVYVCVSVRVRVRECVCVCARVCVCACVSGWMHLVWYVYCACVFVCVPIGSHEERINRTQLARSLAQPSPLQALNSE